MLTFLTSNQNKIDIARRFLSPFKIDFQIENLDVDEIQSNNYEDIAIKKASAAFSSLKKPLFTTDHFWSIPSLNGFPGAYMKFINMWLTAEDLLQLMHGKTNRDIFLYDNLCFIDKKETKLFTEVHKGYILHQKQGNALPAQEITCLTNDDISIATKLEKSASAIKESQLYLNFGNWITNNRPEFIKT